MIPDKFRDARTCAGYRKKGQRSRWEGAKQKQQGATDHGRLMISGMVATKMPISFDIIHNI
jgi:hypothetical protein